MISTLLRHLLLLLSNSLLFHVLKPWKDSLVQIWLELSFPYILSAKRNIKPPPLFYFPSKSEAGAEVGICMSSRHCNCYLTWASSSWKERQASASCPISYNQRPGADVTACLWPCPQVLLSRAATISFRGTSGVMW